MSIINNGLLLASGADAAVGYQISRSLRFSSGDSSYLSRTPASAGNRKTWTWSGWVKRSGLGAQLDFATAADSGDYVRIAGFDSSDRLEFCRSDSSVMKSVTTQVFRDCSAWYHIVIAFDTTQATASNRVKLYVNGTQVTTFSTATYPNQNTDWAVNNTGEHRIGAFKDKTDPTVFYPFSGYLADIYFLDGTATTPSTFAETDAVTGQWVPKTPTGISYGTNGFRLTFSDNSGTTSTTLGKDAAGSNNWTPNNFSVASGSGNDSLTDSPTSYGTDTGAGGEVRGNYATLNPIAGGGGTLANGNLEVSTSTDTPAVATQAMTTGKWYWEFTLTTATNVRVGVYNIGAAAPTNLGGTANGWAIINNPSRTYYNGTLTSYGSFSGASGNVVMVAYDADAGKIWFGENGTWLASGNPATGSNPSFSSVTGSAIVPAACSGGGSNVFNFNAGQRAFAYTAPSGFKALVDTNLTAPVVAKPNTVMDVLLYTGNGTNGQAITGLNFSPEFVWIKKRSAAAGHGLWDVIRGASNTLSTVNTQTEAVNSVYGKLQSFDGNGFTVTAGTDPSDPRDIVNVNGATYVAWAWDAGTSTVTNTQGSINSQVRANTSSGFSVLTATTPTSGSSFSVGHGLGVAPAFAIFKDRGYANSWGIYHKSITTTTGGELLFTTAAAQNYGWFPAAPTSTTFTLSVGGWGTGASIVGYLWAPVAGYSSFGSYTGNGSSDGPFVFTGHRPRWIMIKRTDAAYGWYMYDTARDTYNIAGKELLANASDAEVSDSDLDILSNGFKPRRSSLAFNASGGTFVYAAFAESPFQYARAR